MREKAGFSKMGVSCRRLPQTKIFEGMTNIPECIFEALFWCVSSRFELRNVEKCFENTLRKGWFGLPKSSFGAHNIAVKIPRARQPSATSPHFGQTCLFTNFPNILTIRGSEFKEIRKKTGLSKMGTSCRRLVHDGCTTHARRMHDGLHVLLVSLIVVRAVCSD
jgi:hypothetical protein